MRIQKRRFLSVLLSFALTFEAVMPGLAAAHDSGLPSAVEVSQKVDEMDSLIANANQLPPGQPRNAYAPDRFLLLDQERIGRSYIGRSFAIFSNQIERDIEEHRYRLATARSLYEKVRTLRGDAPEATNACGPEQKDWTEKRIEDEVLSFVNIRRRKDTPLFLYEVRNNPAQLACIEQRIRAIVMEWNYQISDLWETRESLTEVPNVTKAKVKHFERLFNWWDIRVSVLDKEEKEGGGVVANLDMHKTADGKTIAADHASYTCETGETCRFSFRSKDQILNKFHIPTKAIAVLGPYVVFIHENSYDKEQGIQYLSFIDLASYGASLGQADIPVFRMPILAEEAATSLSVSNDGIVINGKTAVKLDAFIPVSEMQQMAFNITSNLVDPEAIAQLMPYIDSVEEVGTQMVRDALKDAAGAGEDMKSAEVLFDKLGKDIKAQILQNKAIADFATGKRLEPTNDQVDALPEVTQNLLKTYSEGLEKSDYLQKKASAVSNRISIGRSMKAKVQSFFNKITSPVPDASLKIKRALVLVGASKTVNNGHFWRTILDRPWLASTLITAGMTYAVAPEAFLHIAEGGLSVGAAIFDYLKFAGLGVVEAVAKGTVATFSPLFDMGASLKAQYWEGDRAYKTLIGVSVFAPFCLSLFFVPHLIFNAHKIYLDKKKPEWKGFVDHQQKFVKEYYERLAADEVKRRDLKADADKEEVPFDEAENAEIMAFVSDRMATSPAFAKKGMIGTAWSRTKESFGKLKSAVLGSKAAKEGDKHVIQGKWAAIKSVAFSYPAMELTLFRWARFWNWFSGTRYTSFGFLTLKDLGLKYNLPVFVRPKPIVMATRMFFPDFFNTTVAKADPVKKKMPDGKMKDKQPVTIPTVLNGGTRTWETRDWTWIKEALLGKPSAVREAEEEVQRELTRSEFKVMSESFEKSVIASENAVFQEALNAAIRRMPEYLADKDELAKLFKDKPLASVTEKRVKELPVRVRTFIRLYTEAIYGASMKELLQPALDEAQGLEEQAPERKELSLAEIKKEMLDLRRRTGSTEAFAFDAAQARAIANRIGKDDELFKAAAKKSKWGEFSLENWIVNRKHNVVADMDPAQNPSMERYATVQGRLKSPNALARAVRAEISKLIITFPVNLGLKMFLAAGIFGTGFAPIQEYFWGPNSIAYFSQDAFYMGMASGFVIGMMADAWMKLQQDARQDEMGDFGLVPKGEDAERGFFRWYMKQYNDPNNGILGNWAFTNRLIFWNFPAALVNMGLFYTLFSGGRLDLSYILGGFALAFGTPLSAFAMKVDQAFERASEYAARGIKDERWLAHPAIQELVSKEKQYYRNRFQLANDLLQQVESNWTQNVETIKTSYGTRGFVRALLGGALFEEAIVNHVLHPAKELTKSVPGVGKTVEVIANGCEALLTKGNVDLKKGGGH